MRDLFMHEIRHSALERHNSPARDLSLSLTRSSGASNTGAMTLHVRRLPFSLDPLTAEAKRRARRRRLLLALGVAAAGAVAVTVAQSGAGPGGASSPGSAGSGVAAQNDGPVLASGVAPVTGGRVVATVTPDTTKVGQRVRATQIAGAPSDASGTAPATRRQWIQIRGFPLPPIPRLASLTKSR